MSYVPRNIWSKVSPNTSRFSTPKPPGPPVTVLLVTGQEKKVEYFTWVEEDGTQLLRCRSILNYRKARVANRTVVIVHWDLEISALEVGVRGINTEYLAASPRNLEGVQ